MRGSLKGIAESQGGIFARHQALAAGYTTKEFEWLTRSKSGPWVKVRYGIYTPRDSWDGLSPDARQLRLDRAALLVCDEGTVLSHSSAARLLGLPLYDAEDGLTHVTRLRLGGRQLSRTQAGICHHSGRLYDDEIVLHQGIAVTSAARTTLDVTSRFGFRAGLVVADAVLRSGVPRANLEAGLLRYPNDQHAAVRRSVVAAADGRAESPLETLGRILLVSMGIADVEPQYEVEFPEGGVAFVDMFSPSLRHVFECDGKLKYRRQVNWKGEEVDAAQVVWDEKQREDKLRGCGYGVSRISWKDTMVERFGVANSRLWREIRLQHAGDGAAQILRRDSA
jgi:hypothetical protein